MMRDKKWLIKQLIGHEIGDYGNYYNGGYEDALAYALVLAHQLDEPEKVVIPQFVAEAFEEYKESNLFVGQFIKEMYDSSDEVAYWLEVPSNEKLLLRAWLGCYDPEKIIIPQSVADWWERDDDSVTMYGRLRVEKKHKFDLISIFYDKGLGDYLSKVEDWIYENDSAFLDLVNGKPYEVEKEKLYYVLNEKGFLMMRKYEGEIDTMRISNTLSIDRIDDASKYLLTEKEIKDYDPRYWSFAVEVEE